MFNRPDDLNDSLYDLIGNVDLEKAANPVQPPASYVPGAGRPNKFKDATLYTEQCRKCRGTGRYNAPSTHGNRCFECDGVGSKTFKTSPEHRAKAKASTNARKSKRAQDIANAILAKRTEFVEQHRDAIKWLHTKSDAGSTFAASLLGGLDRFGSLTEGQLAAVERFKVQDAERAVESANRVENAPVADAAGVDRLKLAFDTAIEYARAKGRGLKTPRITIGNMTISPAKSTSSNPGALYVKNGSEYLGKVQNGRFLGVRTCTEVQEKQVLAFIADPKAAAIAYGIETGVCCICNAQLTNKVSIEAGIGPICATKFGW